jgi:two-component system, sensor histidine kinase
VLPLRRSGSLADYDAREPDAGPAALPQAGRPLRVLLAEDHPTNQRVVQLILTSQGAEVVVAGDEAQALAAFEAGPFDVVLMDMQMPVMDGLSATRGIRAFEARTDRVRTPLVMLSANSMAEHREEALAAGADSHLAKPITAASLLAGIDAVLGN